MEESMRGVVRALDVLKALNQNDGATIVELHRVTGISRPALYRVVRTLCSEGYLRFDEALDRYLLTPLVRHLSDGFDDDAWLTEVASPVLDQLQREVTWPTDLFGFHYDTMIMRRTTRRVSPWTIDRLMVGLRTPMLLTACGRVFLAFQTQRYRDEILDRLAASQHPDDSMAQDRRAVHMLLDQVASKGFATREHGYMKETGSIAVPVLMNGVAQCSLAITYISSALSEAEAVRRYLTQLKEASERISQKFSEEKARGK